MTGFARARRLLWPVIGIAAGTTIVSGRLLDQPSGSAAGWAIAHQIQRRPPRPRKVWSASGRWHWSTESPRSIRCSRVGSRRCW